MKKSIKSIKDYEEKKVKEDKLKRIKESRKMNTGATKL
jgi:hypothetical protein